MAKITTPAKAGNGTLRNIKPINIANLGLRPGDANISAADKSLIDERLNEALRRRIKDVLSSQSEGVLKKLDTVTIDYQSAANFGLNEYILQKIVPQLQKEDGTRPVPFKFVKTDTDEKISDILNLNTPLRKNPLFSDEIRLSYIIEYATLGGLTDTARSGIVELDLRIRPTNNATAARCRLPCRTIPVIENIRIPIADQIQRVRPRGWGWRHGRIRS